MTTLVRLAAAALTAGVFLLAAGPAPAGHALRATHAQSGTTPELFVIPFDSTLRRVNADVGFDIVFPQNQPPQAKLVLYAPAGYAVDLAIPAGTKIGEADATVVANTGRGLWSGDVVVDTAAKYVSDPAAVACAGATAHAAVWLVTLTSSGTTLSFAVFIDATTGTEASLGVYKLQFCLPSPEVPQAAGGAPLGARITDAFVELTRGLTNPNVAGVFLWREYATPYTAGTSTPNQPGTVEVRSIVPLPQVLTLKGRYDRKSKSIVLSGTLTIAGDHIAQVPVTIYGSTKASGQTFKRLASVRTKTKGAYSYKRKASATMYFGALVEAYSTSARCQTGPSAAPSGCVQENLSLEAISKRATVKVPKKR